MRVVTELDYMDHDVIYLEPYCRLCGLYANDERQWCQDDVWDKTCSNCGYAVEATKYVIHYEGMFDI